MDDKASTLTTEDVAWAIKHAYAQGMIDALEKAAAIVEGYDTGAKHIVSKMHADRRKKDIAAAIRAVKDHHESASA